MHRPSSPFGARTLGRVVVGKQLRFSSLVEGLCGSRGSAVATVLTKKGSNQPQSDCSICPKVVP